MFFKSEKKDVYEQINTFGSYIKYNNDAEIILPVEFYDVYDFELNGNKDVFWLKENNELYSRLFCGKIV